MTNKKDAKQQDGKEKKAWKKPGIKSTLSIKETLSGGPGGPDMQGQIAGMSGMS
jgi:hypothetical protein